MKRDSAYATVTGRTEQGRQRGLPDAQPMDTVATLSDGSLTPSAIEKDFQHAQ